MGWSMEKDNRVRRLKRFLLFGPYVLFILLTIVIVFLIVESTSQNDEIISINERIDGIVTNQSDISQKVDNLGNDITNISMNLQRLSDNLDQYKPDNQHYDVYDIPINNSEKGNEWPQKVYLTFDDGPSANTEKILDILAQYGVKGNFFVVGTDDSKRKELYKRIVDEGHVIGMHSYTHKYSEIYVSKEAFANDLDRISTLIYEETGVLPKIYRFPGGSSNSVSKVPMSELIDILNKRGITYYDWNVLSGDATNPALPAEDIIKNSLSTLSEYEEAMILFHDLSNKTTTVEALPSIIESILEQGITIAPIDDTTMLIQHNAK